MLNKISIIYFLCLGLACVAHAGKGGAAAAEGFEAESNIPVSNNIRVVCRIKDVTAEYRAVGLLLPDAPCHLNLAVTVEEGPTPDCLGGRRSTNSKMFCIECLPGDMELIADEMGLNFGRQFGQDAGSVVRSSVLNKLRTFYGRVQNP